jgi:hypothetical protein
VANTICGALPSDIAPRVLLASDLSDRCPLFNANDGTIFGRNLGLDLSRAHGADGYRVVMKTGPGIQAGGYAAVSQYAAPPPADVRIDVDVERISGSEKTLFGLMCRFNLPRGNIASTAYTLTVASDGTYLVEFLGSPTVSNRMLTSGKAVVPQTGVTHIRADCISKTLTLYINGQRIASVDDDALVNGLSGIYTRSTDSAGGTIAFRNLVIAKP